MTRRWVVIVSAALAVAAAIVLWPEGDTEIGVAARAVPMAQSAAARALRLPRIRPSASRAITATDTPVVIDVEVRITGPSPRDSSVPAQALNAACDAAFVDTAVARDGDALQQAIVWVEGPAAALITDTHAEHRPTVRMEGCRLLPRMQVAAPGSMLQLVMRDSMAESLVVVPSAPTLPVDTVAFLMDGQLVPVRSLADSVGVIAIYATRLPWARAFVAITPTASSAITGLDGRARFTLDAHGRRTTIRAWHPSLGIVSGKVTLEAGRTAETVTLTFKR
jgi:hypothetical protein